MSSGFQRSGKMAVTSFSLASDFTRLPLQRGPLEVGSDPFAWIFIKVPMQIASISSSTGPLLSVTHTHASAVGNAENSCLKGQRLPRRTGQASCQLLPPALLLTIWVLASGSCEDRPAVFSLDAVRGYFRGSLYFGAFPSSDILNVQIQIPVRSEQESWNTPRSVCPLGKSCRGGRSNQGQGMSRLLVLNSPLGERNHPDTWASLLPLAYLLVDLAKVIVKS